MKPSTNRRERRAGFLAGREIFPSCPRYKRRAQRRAWWEGRRIGRSVAGGFWLIYFEEEVAQAAAQAAAEISRLLIGPADFSRNFGRDIAKNIAQGIR